jgi:PAS domain S-box-containing protein
MSSQRQESESLDVQVLVDSIPALIHTARPDGYLDYFNKRWLEYLGATLDQVAGWNWTAFVHPEDVQRILTKWRACLETGEIFEYETRVRRADGDYRWMFHRKVPLRDANGNIVKWYGSSLDIEERKTAEEELSRNAQELQRSEFYLAEGQRLAHMGSWAFDPNGFYYWSPELFRMHGLDPAGKPPSVQKYLDCVHPQDRESMADLIKGISMKPSPFDATKRIVRLNGEVRYIRCVGAPVVENQSLKKYVGSALDVTEHELLTQELRRREAYLAEAQRLSQTGSFGWKISTSEVIWSDETFRIFQYDRTLEPSVELVLQRVHPEDVPRVKETIERASQDGQDFDFEHRLLMPDGSIKHLRVVAHALSDESGSTEFVGAVMDITVAQQAEDRIRLVINTVPGLLWSARPDGWVDFINQRWLDYTGMTLEQALGWGWAPAYHPDEIDQVQTEWRAAVAEGKPLEIETRLRRFDGEYRWFLERVSPLFDSAGHILGWYGSDIDIQDKKRAEEELRASERKYRHLVDTTPAFVNTALPNGDVDFFNHGWEEYVGLPFIDMLGWRWTSAIHPEDVEAFVGKWRAALESGERFVAEARVRRADGEYRWLLQRSEPLRNEAGEIVKWYGSSIEIHERKTAENKIREQEIELRQILDLTPQLVAVYGPNRERLYANPLTLHYLGLSLEEWRRPFLHRESPVHPDDCDRVDSFFNRGSAGEMESRLRKSDGTYRWFLTRFNPLRDEQGHITRWYVASTDIEDRKRAEEKLQQENFALREEIHKASMFEDIVGTSPALKSVLSRISKVAPSDSTVLITGETGTGKELVARAIHRRSDRASRAFVSANCAAIPRDLIASELFGHEKGAFTGATQQRLGRFELANGGTIFLDEVGELPTETQIALLRVLQEHEFERVGGSRRIRADVRVVAATNRDLQAAISGGSFRSDLFYRLNVFPIEIPSLRERREDIPLLVEYFIDLYARRAGKNIKRVSKKTLELLQSYLWPGNIRELQNVIERSVILCETEIFSIDESWLPTRPPITPEPKRQVELPRRLLVQEKDMIETALKDTRGRVSGPTGAAVKLGIPRSTLESKIRSLKINKNHFKS